MTLVHSLVICPLLYSCVHWSINSVFRYTTTTNTKVGLVALRCRFRIADKTEAIFLRKAGTCCNFYLEMLRFKNSCHSMGSFRGTNTVCSAVLFAIGSIDFCDANNRLLAATPIRECTSYRLPRHYKISFIAEAKSAFQTAHCCYYHGKWWYHRRSQHTILL